MNLWRIAVDAVERHAAGAPEPVTTGVQASAGCRGFSKDGSRLAFRSRVGSINPVAIPFDPGDAARRRAVAARHAQQHPRAERRVAGRQADRVLQHRRAPGGSLHRPAGRPDAARDRRSRRAIAAPVFTPDGRSLVFYSNRDGKWAAWTIGLDGGGLRKTRRARRRRRLRVLSRRRATRSSSSSTPAGGVYSRRCRRQLEQPTTELPGTTVGGKFFTADGVVAGRHAAGRHLASRERTARRRRRLRLRRAEDDGWSRPTRRMAVEWLPDSRRVVYFTKNGNELVVLDTVTRARTVVDVRLPGAVHRRDVRDQSATTGRSITAPRAPRRTSGSSSAPRRSRIANR